MAPIDHKGTRMTDLARNHQGIAAVALFVAGMLVGAWALHPPRPAHAAMAAIGADSCLPAVPFGRDQLVLLKDKQGLYFVLDGAGLAAPIRFRDTELRTIPSESLLMAP